MTKKQYRNATGIFSTQLAICSFVIGTLLLILFLVSKNNNLLGIGLVYVVFATTVNIIMFLRLLFLLFTHKNHTEYYTIKILILLANIPIAFVYVRIVAEIYE